jgi:hypothetical protein
MSRWCLSFLVVAACGLDARGTMATDGGGAPIEAGGLDAGSPVDAADEGDDGGTSAGYCASLAGDTTVMLCLDFDTPAQSIAPYGFVGLAKPPDSTFMLADGALTVALADGSGSRMARGYKGLFPSMSPFPSVHPVMDADIVVHERTNNPALLTFDVLGTGLCGHFPGVGAGDDGVYPTSTPLLPVTPLPLEQKFHVNIDITVTPGASGPRTVTVDGNLLTNAPVAYEDTCNFVGISAGTFFTATNQGRASATFDRIVVRRL